MNKERLLFFMKAPLEDEEHLGDNLKKQCIDYIDNLEQQCKKQKEVIDNTINNIDVVIEVVKQQPTKDHRWILDRWILDRLNGFKIILEDKEVSK